MLALFYRKPTKQDDGEVLVRAAPQLISGSSAYMYMSV